MSETSKEKIDKLGRRAMTIYYLLMTATVCAVGIIAYLQTSVNWVPWYIGMFVVIHLSWGTASYLQDSVVDECFIPYYFIFMHVYLFPAVLILWEGQVYSVLALYVLLPLIVPSRHYALKYLIASSISSIICVVVLFVMSACGSVKIAYFDGIEPRIIVLLNTIIATMALSGFTLFIYCYCKIFQIMTNENNNSVIKMKEKAETTEDTKQKELHNKIIVYFETKQPYKQAQYNLPMLASDLDTNTKYLSEAINKYYGSFNSLLNKYRLELVRKMLEDRLTDTYTMEYIYTLAGYSSHSAFYSNFYKTFQATPLEYQRMLKSKTVVSK
jgi:AraC-like DNA-binding protein